MAVHVVICYLAIYCVITKIISVALLFHPGLGLALS